MRRSKKLVDKLSDDENETNTIQINSSNGRLDPKWRGLFLRSVFGILLIVTFSLIIKVGPIGLVFMVLVIYFRGFQELCNVGYEAFNLRTVPYYKQTSFTLFFIFNYFVLGHKIIEKFGHVLNKYSFTMLLAQHHKFISFNLYTIYFLIFVLMLQKPHYRKQYTLYSYTHMIMLVYASCYMTIGNILEGSIWFIYPVLLVVFNDIAAYVFGFFLGKTKLIDVSPNKTWEGFVGAFFTTLLFGQVICPLMCPYDFFTCPVDFLSDQTGSHCTNLLFRMEQVEIFGSSFGIYPFQKHALVLSLYASLVSPFGGFFASGFKRAIGIKDFGNTIPGHGGIIDRFDCHIITNIFVNLYINSII